MKPINTVNLIYFSPTNTTRRIVEMIAEGFSPPTMKRFDLTLPGNDTKSFSPIRGNLTIIGAPVYGGRIPKTFVERIRRITAQSAPVVVVVVYGNREYEDALIELNDLAMKSGFNPIAGGAFIGEHSFADRSKPIALGRPDKADAFTAIDFGIRIKEKFESLCEVSDSTLELPGNVPYKEDLPDLETSPVTADELCTQCGVCVEACPTGAINTGDMTITDPKLCIQCCACIKVCQFEARVMEHPGILQKTDWLFNNCQKRKEPVMYFKDKSKVIRF